MKFHCPFLGKVDISGKYKLTNKLELFEHTTSVVAIARVYTSLKIYHRITIQIRMTSLMVIV